MDINSYFVVISFLILAILIVVYVFFNRHSNAQDLKIAELQDADTSKIQEINALNEKINDRNVNLAILTQSEITLKATVMKLEEDIKEAASKSDSERESKGQLNESYQALLAQQSERDAGFDRQLESLEEQKRVLKSEFENLANKIFDEKGKKIDQANTTSLGHILTPLKAQIDGFQKRVNDIHEASERGNVALGNEIAKVADVGLKMQTDAISLTQALKGDSQVLGAWGEAQLERTLQMSGLENDTHYSVQDSFTSGGKTKRTDVVIRLPDERCMVIDSKMTLTDYERYTSSKNETEAAANLKAHIATVRGHVKSLSAKDYSNLPGLDTPDYILMFMPIESAYIEALKHDKELFSFAHQMNIILVSHTTLVPLLRVVSSLWPLQKTSKQARELGDVALEVWNKVCGVTDVVRDLGKSLNSSGNHYGKLVNSLVGQQGLAKKVKRFDELSINAKKSLSQLEAVQIAEPDDRLKLATKTPRMAVLDDSDAS